MSKERITHILKRAVAEVIVREELEKLLDEDKPLRLKMGFDPSRPDIHLGHAVGLRKLRQLQELGHQLTLIVGDWTAQIGDPSGQSLTRPMITAQEVQSNARTYMDQFFKIVDKDRTEVRWQSEWFGEFTLADIIKLTSKFTVAQLLARDDFSKRYAANKPIAITEFLYPLLQAYDSVVLEADVEFGGTDQKFNLLLGRELQGMTGQHPQQCLLVPILVGTDGVHRMSKSLDNYIGIDEPAKDIYFKVMRLKDSQIISYFDLVTDVPEAELDEMEQTLENRSVNPMELKKRLAREIVTQFHSGGAAVQAEKAFEKIVQRKEAPDQTIDFPLSFSSPSSDESRGVVLPKGRMGQPAPCGSSSDLPEDTAYSLFLPQLLVKVGLSKSGSEARRLIRGGGVRIDGVKIDDEIIELANVGEGRPDQANFDAPSKLYPNSLIKAGKRHTIKIVDTDSSS